MRLDDFVIYSKLWEMEILFDFLLQLEFVYGIDDGVYLRWSRVRKKSQLNRFWDVHSLTEVLINAKDTLTAISAALFTNGNSQSKTGFKIPFTHYMFFQRLDFLQNWQWNMNAYKNSELNEDTRNVQTSPYKNPFDHSYTTNVIARTFLVTW